MKTLWVLASIFCLNGMGFVEPLQYGVEGLYSGQLDCPGAHTPSECKALAGNVHVTILQTGDVRGLLMTVHSKTGIAGGDFRFNRCALTRSGTAVEGSMGGRTIAEMFAYLNPDTGEMEAVIRDAALATDLRIVARRVLSPRELFPAVPGGVGISGTDLVGEYKVNSPVSPGRFFFNVTLGGTPPYLAAYEPGFGEKLTFSGGYNRDLGLIELSTPFSGGFATKWFLRAGPDYLTGYGISTRDGTWQTISLRRRRLFKEPGLLVP